MAWVSEPALSATAEARSEDILVLATLVLDTAEAVSMEALAHYRSPEPFQVAQSYRVPCFRVRHTRSWAAELRTLVASVCLGRTAELRTLAASVCLGRTAADMVGRTVADMVGRTAADMVGHTAADMVGHTAHPDTTTSVYRTRVTQLAATAPPARQRQER